MDGPRLVRRDELDDLAKLLCQVFGFDQYYSQERVDSGLRRRLHRRGGRIIAEDGKPVSHMLTALDTIFIYGCRVRVASIGSVSTHPDYRGRGYAGEILQRSIEDSIKARARVMIVSGDRSLYRRNHCVPAGHLYEAALDCGASEAVAGLKARRVGPEAWPTLAPLYQAEPVRFVRGTDLFSQVCFWWDCSFPQIWVIESDDVPLAYLSLTPTSRDDREGPERVVAEYAGSRAAILEGLPALASAAGIERIHFRLLGQDRELLYLLNRRGAALRPGRISGTLRLLNLPGLLRDLRPYLSARLPRADLRRFTATQQGETCTFAYDTQRLALNLSQAAPLVLGGPEETPAPGGELGRVLAAIFPVQLPMPGFNYV